MAWFERLPSSIAFVDVETTGLDSDDRVVSLGAFWIASGSLCDRQFPVSFVHLIFNPGRRCHPNAAQVHGYSDSLLAHQDPFETYVDEIRSFLCGADLIVAHNSKFDLGFINAELARANRPTIDRSSFCTMEACRALGIRASLDAVSHKLGLARSTRQHGALEDAWLAMMVYLWLHGCPTRRPFTEPATLAAPFNLVPVTPRWPVGDDRVPANAASNTGRSLAGTTDEAARIDALVEKVKQLKRDHSYEQAEALLLEEVARQEAAARTTGIGVAPWYYEQLAVIYSKQHRYRDEVLILERYKGQPKAPGVMPAQLLARLEKARHRLPSLEAN